MWDLKLLVIDFFFYANLTFLNLLSLFLNTIDPVFHNGFILFNWKVWYQFAQNMGIFFAFKFVFAIGFLILIRGGTPRYRYDYLTKLGWIKFLTLVIVVFSITVLFFFLI